MRLQTMERYPSSYKHECLKFGGMPVCLLLEFIPVKSREKAQFLCQFTTCLGKEDDSQECVTCRFGMYL
ncbi:hypothetical protein CD33_14640 [Ureibacillus sinduriensis BLB-1 = JCM 15800]|uniref:Uncharacterized protein n=1 Tax=Ureibacillus sinduriensis BLB-1 = JCM 15800 TaxID=1384057 RepID=A0A0A3HUS5_9BACL|nr:hypothetical protein CD33_14640 [Ureibacillus sinduriensis BLB-1 = JCM 15800]